jgi:transcriptional regulator GlxA family with amidase domain
MPKVSFWAGEGCLFSGIVSLIDAFSIANLWHQALGPDGATPLFETQIVTTDGLPVTAHGNIKVTPHNAIGDVKQTDMIIISPILPHLGPLPDNFGDLSRWIKAWRQKGALVGAVCTGAFILAETGLLDGRIATTNWQFAKLFRQRYPRVNLRPEMLLTEDGGLLCTGAATAVYNLGLFMIKQYGSEKLASVWSKALLIDPNRDSQTPYVMMDSGKGHNDRQVLKAQLLMEKNYTELTVVDAIAKEVGISPRHFKRRFKSATGQSPLKYIQHLRIESAKKILETTHLTIDEITRQIGYEDSSSFCRLFKHHTQLSPKAYRDKFFCGPRLDSRPIFNTTQ